MHPTNLLPHQILALAQKIKDQSDIPVRSSPSTDDTAVPDIQLCSGVYKLTGTDLPPIKVICQIVVFNGSTYVWVDGVSEHTPVLLPVQNLEGFRRMGTLRQYLGAERHLALDEEFDLLGMLCAEQKVSATLMVRACEVMHAEGLLAGEALDVVRQWGELICELDQAERIAFQVIVDADKAGASLEA